MIDLATVSRLTRLAAMLAAGVALMAATDIANAKSNRRHEGDKLTQPAANTSAQTENLVASSDPVVLHCVETNSNQPSPGRPVATISNGVITSTIFNGPGGLELSANAPGTITVTSGSNSVTLRGNRVTLSGAIALARRATPGVTVTPNAQGGYTVVRNAPCIVLVDADPHDEIAGVGQLEHVCAETGHSFEDIGNDFDR